MTGNLVLDSAVSLAAIGLMVLLAWAMFRAPSNPVTEVEARERLALDEPDFRPIGWLFDRDGASVLIEGAGGDYALVSRLGLDLVTRRFDPATMKATEESGVLTIRPGDPGSRAIRLVSPDAAAWARKLA